MLRLPPKKIAVTPLFDTLKYGSLFIPETARERVDQGIVKYIGDNCKWIGIGDHVTFSGYTGTLLSLEGEGLLIILPEEFVVGVIDYDSTDVARVEIPGLYFKGTDDEFFEATYEMVVNLLAKGLEESKVWSKLTGDKHRKWKIHEQRPKVSDYDRLR